MTVIDLRTIECPPLIGSTNGAQTVLSIEHRIEPFWRQPILAKIATPCIP
jgi:hypothetical protein